MSIINNILQEEFDRLERVQRAYENELLKLPKGSIVKKRINGHDYYYLQYRNGQQIRSKYIKADSVQNVNLDINRRKEIKDALKRIEKEKKTLKKVLENV